MKSSISQAELVRANGNKPLIWPSDPLRAMLYMIWLQKQLAKFVDKDRLSHAAIMGSYGDPETDGKMSDTIRRISWMNSLHAGHDAPTGLKGVMWLICTPPDQWPYEAERYDRT